MLEKGVLKELPDQPPLEAFSSGAGVEEETVTASGQSTATESTPEVTVTEAFLDQTAVYVTDAEAVVLFNSEPDHEYVYDILHPAGATVQVTL